MSNIGWGASQPPIPSRQVYGPYDLMPARDPREQMIRDGSFPGGEDLARGEVFPGGERDFLMMLLQNPQATQAMPNALQRLLSGQ
jgi:hypothetical protein